MAPTRTPPVEVRRKLRKEVNFGCPICRSPFLTWHHFDPPWEPKHKHVISGMVALCSTCHRLADGGSFTIAQLRQLKENAPKEPPKGTLPWNVENALVIIGGNYLTTHKNKKFSVRFGGRKVFSFKMKENGYLTINASIWNRNKELILCIEENDIISYPEKMEDFVCTAQAKGLSVSSKNDDASLSLSFKRVEKEDILNRIKTDLIPKTLDVGIHDPYLKQMLEKILDTDRTVPTIEFDINVYSYGVSIKTTKEGIYPNLKELGFDEEPVLTGKCFGDNCLKIFMNGREILYMGSE